MLPGLHTLRQRHPPRGAAELAGAANAPTITSFITRSPFADPGISPNQDGLPGLTVVRHIVGALLTWGLVACVAGLVVSVIVWAVARQQGNYGYASGGKTGVLVSAGGALLIGGANANVAYFSGLGAQI